MNIIFFTQSFAYFLLPYENCKEGIGLPDRNYYFDKDKEEKRKACELYIAKMLSLVKDSTPTNVDKALIPITDQIYELEFKLVEAYITKTENYDLEATCNKMSIDELTKI